MAAEVGLLRGCRGVYFLQQCERHQHSIRIIEEPQVSQPPPFARGVTLSDVPAVIDGDTIRLACRVVQIFGIDAPESAQKFRNSGTP